MLKKILFVCLFFLQLLFAQQTFTIASENEDSTYDVLAQSIKKIVETHSKYKINIVHTRGSVDNIKRLAAGKVDFAIVQNDTALYAENGFSPFKEPIESLQTLMMFYDEPIYIITNKEGINSIEQLDNMYVNVGQKNSGLLASAKVLLRSAKLWTHITPFYQNSEKSIRYLEQNRVQAIFLNSLNEKVKKYIAESKWHLVPIPKRVIQKLQKTFAYFDAYSIEDNLYTVAVRSMLISRDSIDMSTCKTIVSLLYKHYDELIFPEDKKNKNKCFCSSPLSSWHPGAEQFFLENNIHPDRGYWVNPYITYAAGIVILFFILLFALLLIYNKTSLSKKLHTKDHYFFNMLKVIYLKIVDYKYVIFFIIVFLLYMVSILFIRHYEHQWALHNNVYSPFDDFSLKDSLIWLFVFATSGFNDNVFPQSDEGKFFVSLIPMIGLGGILAFATLLASDTIKKFLLEVKGMGSVNYENHIILCGWNKNGCNILQALTHDNIERKSKIVILAEEQYKSEIDLCILKYKHVTHIVGHAKSREDLNRANLTKSKTVVVLQSDKHTDPDAYAILDVLTINKYATDLKLRETEGSEFQIIVQLHSNDNKSIAMDAGADQIISLASIESNILSNMIQTPGVNKFVEEVFDFNDTNDIYSIDVTTHSKLIGKTYNEALVMLREYNILLLSINIGYHRSQEETDVLKKEYTLSRDVITNPINPKENAYLLHEGDMLIVLAQYEQTVLDAVEKLEGV